MATALGLTPAPAPETPANLGCIHLGKETGKLVRCATCAGTKLKVFECAVFGTCTIGKRGVGAGGCCNGCYKRQPAEQSAVNGTLTPAPAVAQGPLSWVCAVTTVPSRRQTHLPKTLAAIENAGFPAPWLFVDGAPLQSEAQDYHSGLRIAGATFRSTPARVHGNWFLALHELWIRYPMVDRYCMFQDDVIMCRNVRQLLEASTLTSGYFNLYTSPNERYFAGLKHHTKGWVQSTQRGKGALALVFDRTAVETLLTSRHMVMRPVPTEHKDVIAQKQGDWYRGQCVVDGGIVESLSTKAGIKEYIHLPTLAQHIGAVSSFSNLRHPIAEDFPGEDVDAMSLDQSFQEVAAGR